MPANAAAAVIAQVTATLLEYAAKNLPRRPPRVIKAAIDEFVTQAGLKSTIKIGGSSRKAAP